jgi:hypothetical protein
MPAMIHGAHLLLYSTDPEADRGFFRDVLKYPNVDVGGGWLIFKLPPAELAVHPADAETQPREGHRMLGAHLYLMCDDLKQTIAMLKSKQIACTGVEKERWGIRTTVNLPSGGEIGLYQPTHKTAWGSKGSDFDLNRMDSWRASGLRRLEVQLQGLHQILERLFFGRTLARDVHFEAGGNVQTLLSPHGRCEWSFHGLNGS